MLPYTNAPAAWWREFVLSAPARTAKLAVVRPDGAPHVPAELRAWATRIGGRYMGADHAEEYGRRNGVPPEMLVRVSPARIIAKVDIAN